VGKPELERIDIEEPWGGYDAAVKTGIRFWDWWDSDSDSDRALSSSPSDALEATLLGYLPEDDPTNAPKAKLIAQATRLITNDRFTDAYTRIFNGLEYQKLTGVPLPGTPEPRNITDLNTLERFSELISSEEIKGE